MEERHFVKNDQGFVCAHCGQTVEPLGYTSRNHCPHCLYSLHVDIHPGDRQNPCRGLMEPVGLDISAKKGYVIRFRCTKCGGEGRKKAARDDDFGLLLRLSAKEC